MGASGGSSFARSRVPFAVALGSLTEVTLYGISTPANVPAGRFAPAREILALARLDEVPRDCASSIVEKRIIAEGI